MSELRSCESVSKVVEEGRREGLSERKDFSKDFTCKSMASGNNVKKKKKKKLIM